MGKNSEANKKKKWKKSNKGDVADKNDADEEAVVLVEPTPVENLPPVEQTPEPSPQPTPEPKKPKNKKKNKIPIEDVEEVMEEVVTEAPAPELVEAPVVVEEEEVVEKVEVVEVPS